MRLIRHNPSKIFSAGRRGQSGTAAIEFAMIAPIFFLLLFASLETGMAYFANMVLQNGVNETARLIRTGQAQSQNMTKDQFRTKMCDEVKVLLSCDSNKLYVDVRAFASFGGSNAPPPLDGNGNMSGGMDNYDLGGSSKNGGNTIVLYRAFYKWKLYTPLFGEYFANMSGNIRLLSSAAAFRNEPF